MPPSTGAPQFLETAMKNNGLGHGAGSGPAVLCPAASDASPRGRTPSPIAPRRGDRQGAGQTMASAAAQGAPRVLARRHPPAAGPSRKCPTKLEGLPEPQVPRGRRGVRGCDPRIPGHGRWEKWVAGRRAPVAERAGAGWGRGARAGRLGARPPSQPTPGPRRPSWSPGTYGGSGPRARRCSASGGGGRGEAPVAELRRRSRGACGEGTRLLEGRLRRRGEGEPADPAPGAGRGRSRGCGERRGGLGGAHRAAQHSPAIPEAAQRTAQSQEADWSGLYRKGWSGPEARPRDPEAAAAGPVRLRTPAGSFGTRAGGSPGYSVVGARGSMGPFVDPTVWGRGGRGRGEPSSSSDNSQWPKRVGRRRDSWWWWRGERGSAATRGNTRQLCRGARARVRGPFAITLALNCVESGPSFPSHCYIPRHLSPQAVFSVCPRLPSHGDAHLPQPPGFQFSLANDLLCQACPSSQMSHLPRSLTLKPCENESLTHMLTKPLFSISWILLIFHPSLVQLSDI